MKIKELLAEKPKKQVEGILPSAKLQDAATKLIDLKIGALVVFEQSGRMVGIVSERDLLPVVANPEGRLANTCVETVMTRDVITCRPDDEVGRLLQLMGAHSIRHVPIVEDTEVIDIVSIRELTTAYDLLRKEADTDPLTALPNRRSFLQKLEVEYARATRFKHQLAVAMIDIDHFKAVNDTYGHDAGDRVLLATAAMLMTEFRTIDLVGRLGGEEFAAIFPETDIRRAKVACQRLLDTVEAYTLSIGGKQIRITASIGLAGVSAATREGKCILRQADESLYDAKRSGRNRLVAKAC